MKGVFELKLVKGKSLPFSAVEKHQITALLAASSGEGCYHKLSDESSGQKPFDCFNLAVVPAYVVPVWYIPRKRKTAYYIPIHDFILMRDRADRKSFTEEMAEEHASLIVEL